MKKKPQAHPHITHKLTMYEEARLLLLRVGKNKGAQGWRVRGFACVVGALFGQKIRDKRLHIPFRIPPPSTQYLSPVKRTPRQ